MKRLFKFKYPKLFLLAISIIAAYIMFSNDYFVQNIQGIGNVYVACFVAGALFTFGFTAPFAVGYFITLSSEKVLLLGLIAGVGALMGDMLIFYTLKYSFRNEFNRFKRTKIIKRIFGEIKLRINRKVIFYFTYALAGVLIASPLPDEFGVLLMTAMTKIKAKNLAVISFFMNTIGIIILIAL